MLTCCRLTSRESLTACKGGATTTAGGPDLVERQKGEATGAAALEQLNRPGRNAVVIHHHLSQACSGGHLQSQAVTVLHLAELGDRSVDAVQPGFQQQPQGPGAPALLQRITATLQAGDLPFKPGLLLFQSSAGALLHGEGISRLLNRLLALRQGLEQALPVLLELLQSLLDRLLIVPVLALLLLQFREPFRFLAQAFLQLLLLLQQGSEAGLQLLSTRAALFLLFQPGARTACHIRQPAS